MKVKSFFKNHGVTLAIGMAGVFVGAIVSGVAIVRAAIPDATGSIHGCRNSTTTILRVIDSASQSCDGNETALNWDQSGIEGYARVKPNPSGGYMINAAHSKNATDVTINTVDIGSGYTSTYTCVTFATTPHGVLLAGDTLASFKDASGWSDSNSDFNANCPSGANVAVRITDTGSPDIFMNSILVY